MYNGFPLYQHITRPELFIWFKGGFSANRYGWGYVLGPHPVIQNMPYAYSSANSEIDLRNGIGLWKQQCVREPQIWKWMLLDKPVAVAVGFSCTICSKGMFSNTSNVAGCTACDATSYSDAIGATICTKCNATSNLMPNTERTMCMCKPGWTLAQSPSETQRGECLQCAAGKFKNKTGDDACLSCEHVKTQGGVLTCVNIVSFSLFLTELSENQYEALRSSIAKAFGLTADMVEISITPEGSRRLLSQPFAVDVTVSIPNNDASGASTPPIPSMRNIYQGLAADDFVSATMLIDGGTDAVHLTQGFPPNIQLRVVLNTNIGGSWSAGDKVVVYENGQPGINNVVLTYVGKTGDSGVGTWSPVNCEPMLQSNSRYLFFLKGGQLNLYMST